MPNTFKLDAAGTIYKFQALSKEEKEQWIGALGQAMVKKSVLVDPLFDEMPDI